MTPTSLRCWLLAASVLFAQGAAADPQANLLAAFEKSFAKGRQLRAQMVSEAAGEPPVSMQTDMVLPDRFHTRNERGEFVITPEGSWMLAAGSSEWKAFPLNPASMSAAYTSEGFARMRAGMREVKVLGAETVNGQATQRFGWQANTEYMGLRTSSDNVAWIGVDCGCILRMRTTATTEGKTATTIIDYVEASGLVIAKPAAVPGQP